MQQPATFAPYIQSGNLVLCFMIQESTQAELGGINILGSFQQTNQRIIFGVFNSELTFAPQDCLQNN